MNNTPSQSTDQPSEESRETTSMMFAQLVMQQSNMALIFLGKTAHPQTGEITQDLDHARYFIDQLEMLEVKTRGNLDPHEGALLKQTLTTLRLAFVEAVSKPQTPQTPPAPAENAAAPPARSAPEEQPAPNAPGAAATSSSGAEETQKKFTKKY